jgi:hypothetical protein
VGPLKGLEETVVSFCPSETQPITTTINANIPGQTRAFMTYLLQGGEKLASGRHFVQSDFVPISLTPMRR